MVGDDIGRRVRRIREAVAGFRAVALGERPRLAHPALEAPEYGG